jgi:hypothetical protein
MTRSLTKPLRNTCGKPLRVGGLFLGLSFSPATTCLLGSGLNLGHRYGHGVLRSPDPRFIALQEFCDKRPELLASPTIQLVKQTYEVAPGVLTEHGKTKNPWPNVDAASGCVLYHYGLTQFKVSCSRFSPSELNLSAFTVLHGHLRCLPRWVLTLSAHFLWKVISPIVALGCLSQLVWARGMSPHFRFTTCLLT